MVGEDGRKDNPRSFGGMIRVTFRCFAHACITIKMIIKMDQLLLSLVFRHLLIRIQKRFWFRLFPVAVYSNERCSPRQHVSLITGSVKQMKAQNKWGLHLLGAKYVTVPCGFILGVRVHSKFNPTVWNSSYFQASTSKGTETCEWFLMSVQFNIRTDQPALPFAGWPAGVSSL